MGNKVTVVLDLENEERLRVLQEKMATESSRHVSFSHLVNLVLADGLKKYRST